MIFLLDAPRRHGVDLSSYRGEVLRTGTWAYGDGSFTITPATLKEMSDNFRAGIKGHEVCLNREHDRDRPCGWVKSLELSPDGSRLFALFDITNDDARKLVDEGSLKYLSSELDLAWTDPEAGADGRPKPVFEGLALTNSPYIKRMEPVACINLSDSADLPRRGGDTQINGGSQMAEDQTVSLSDFTALSERLARSERETATLNRKLKLNQVESHLLTLAKSGRLTRPVYNRVLRLCEILVLSGNSTLTLSEPVRVRGKIKLEEGMPVPIGEPEDDIDKVDVVSELLDMLQQLPDAIATDAADTMPAVDPTAAPMSTDEDEDTASGALGAAADKLLSEGKAKTFKEALKLAEKASKSAIRGGAR